MKYVEGLSIRAAESLATRWGNCAYGAEPIEDDGETFTFGVVFLDYETNVRAARLGRVSRRYKKSERRGGGYAVTPEDRFNDVVIPAKQSKILRECILRALPSGLTKAYMLRAKELMKIQFTPEQQKKLREQILSQFDKLKVTEEQLAEILGKPLNMGVTQNELIHLKGILNALKDGETTVEQLIQDRKGDLQKTQTASAEDALLAAQAQASEKKEESKSGQQSSPTVEEGRQEELKEREASQPPAAKTDPKKSKAATPKQKIVNMLTPLAMANQTAFNKACKQAVGGVIQEGLDMEVALSNFTLKELERINEALKNPQADPPAENRGAITPDEAKEPATEPAAAQKPPSKGSAPEQTEPEKPKASGGNPEKAGLIKFIKEHGSSVENKIGIISEVVGSDVNDQALADMADNPGLIEDIAHLRSVKNILSMMGE